MTSYSKNKGFIPESFIEKVELKNTRMEKRILKLFLCINLVCIPFTIKVINNNFNNKVEKNEQYSYSEKEGFNNEHIINITKSLLSDEIKECDLTNDAGKVVVEDIDKAINMNKNNGIEFDEISLNDDGYFEMRVTAYEKKAD